MATSGTHSSKSCHLFWCLQRRIKAGTGSQRERGRESEREISGAEDSSVLAGGHPCVDLGSKNGDAPQSASTLKFFSLVEYGSRNESSPSDRQTEV
ncbi:hypothetical protein Q8A67_022024 [Cirrhinus molitorella]|uniref:Uncharacterized protein n=1 Tax=Cirrhinus molitorella TaxID=172907 RepID=A0AA88TF05_9TELE|nr:hypothetical protein Q8A67_022024 [Cirrhinus molitorella]